ncbi:MAG: UDP-glucose 4-epimerase GalE [Bacillota bacterium]
MVSKNAGVRVLVTGGAGYIGSHTVKALLEAGYQVTVYDDLSRGNPEFIPGVPLIIGRTEDEGALRDVFSTGAFDAVVHFAGESLVGESMRNPEKYYRRNVVGGLTLLWTMARAGVQKMVFSSSAGVYGTPDEIPIKESCPMNPISPYGESKMIIERAMLWFDKAYGLKSVSLRYFNAAGAHPSGKLGEEHDPETHLIPLAIKAAITGEPITIFGDDYPTHDGTCIRDYVHVVDLARAHVLALDRLCQESESLVLNLGAGRGYSNLEVVETVGLITGKKVPYVVGERRMGDSPVLVSCIQKAKEVLGWTPVCSSIEGIVETAWCWHTRNNR